MEMLTAKESELVVSAIAGIAQMGETGRPAIPDLKKLADKEEGIRKAAEHAIKILNEESKAKDKKK